MILLAAIPTPIIIKISKNNSWITEALINIITIIRRPKNVIKTPVIIGLKAPILSIINPEIGDKIATSIAPGNMNNPA